MYTTTPEATHIGTHKTRHTRQTNAQTDTCTHFRKTMVTTTSEATT